MYEIKIAENERAAEKIGLFLTGPEAFEQTWAPREKEFVLRAPLDSLGRANHRYWYIEDNEEVVAAIGIRENKYGSGGYEMDQDYVAVHKNFRRMGLANRLLKVAEEFVRQNKGRYIHVLTCDIKSYEPARKFYEENGYKKVSEIPNYYVTGEGRIDYFKEF